MPPNIVVIVADDMRSDWLSPMTRTLAFFADGGTVCLNGYTTTPLCAPARASLLTGKLMRNHGVGGNGQGDDLDELSTVAYALKMAAGYRTGLVGKYLNGYPFGRAAFVPHGWEFWRAFTNGQGYYDYKIFNGQVTTPHGSAPDDYSTDHLGEKAVKFLEVEDERPFFLWFAPVAPHGPTPANRHQGDLVELPMTSPAFNEADVTDKPSWIRNLNTWGPNASGDIEQDARKRMRTLLALDEAVGDLIDTLEDTGKLDDTAFFFVGDNGFFFGEHRLLKVKRHPYEEAIRIPYLVKLPSEIGTPATLSNLVLNIDLAPTILELAGLEPEGLDGASLLPLLAGNTAGWRTEFTIEGPGEPRTGMPAWEGVHRGSVKEISYATGQTEAYDLANDPYELVNLG